MFTFPTECHDFRQDPSLHETPILDFNVPVAQPQPETDPVLPELLAEGLAMITP
jgi:hypothetical protein